MPYVKHVSTPKCSPKNLLSYIHRADRTMIGKRDDAIPKVGTLLGTTPDEMTMEMDMLKRSFPEKTDYKRQYIHIEISYAKGDGVTAAGQKGVSENEIYYEHLHRVMAEMFPKGQWDGGLHLNRPSPHWHVGLNYIGTDGKLIKTHYLQEKLREVSDRHAKDLGLSIIDARQHAALRRDSMEERNALAEGRMLIVTQLRMKAAEVLKRSQANTLYGLQQEFESQGIDLSRTGDEGGLVYRYNNRYFPASRLGKVFQLYGLKRTMEVGFEKAKTEIELMPKTVKFRDLNLQARDSSYTLLSIGETRPMDDRRELMSILANTRLVSKSLEEFKEELSAHGIEIKGDTKFTYKYEDQPYAESSLQRQFRKESLTKHFEDKDMGSSGGTTREYIPTQEEETVRKPALEESREQVTEQEQSVKHVQQDDRRR
ncbi:MAG: relaxase/mobilization nuclease domain-containing protein [Nitrospiraceae bacterium]|nr:relaxase/mobilization nuclease domain-containing protein [Nitrospiraceae bacterium]